MSKRSRAKHRMGVSEVIASLILLFVVSVLGTFLYSYTLSSALSTHNAIQDEARRHSEMAQENFRVIAAWWSGSGDSLSLTVLNYGKIDIKIIDIYVNGVRATSFTATGGVEIVTSKWKRISFTSPVSISSDTTYEIVLVTKRGVSNVYVCRL